jgi:hypothetical protein
VADHGRRPHAEINGGVVTSESPGLDGDASTLFVLVGPARRASWRGAVHSTGIEVGRDGRAFG